MLVEFSGRSRPSDKGGGGSHPDPEITWQGGGGGAVSKKKKLKNEGSPGPLGPSLDLPLELTLADILYTVINLMCFLL